MSTEPLIPQSALRPEVAPEVAPAATGAGAEGLAGAEALAGMIGNRAFSAAVARASTPPGLGGTRPGRPLARQTFLPEPPAPKQPSPLDDPSVIWLGPRPFGAPGPAVPPDLGIELGVTPDPNDPYEMPPTNWNEMAAPASGPPIPAPWPGVNVPAKPPLPFLDLTGKPTRSVRPDQRAKAEAAVTAFEQSQLVANTSWNTAAPLLEEHAKASEELGPHGMLGKDGGLGWNPPGAPDADMSQLTGAQKLGPHNETSVDKLFQNKDGSPGTDPGVAPGDVKGNKKTAALSNDVRVAGGALDTAAKEHALAQLAVKGAASSVRAAVLTVQINDKQIAADELDAKKHHLESEKATALEKLEGIAALIEGGTLVGFGVAESVGEGHIMEGAESVAIGVEMWADAAVKAKISADFDPQIEKLDADIRAAVAGIRGMQAEAAQAQLDAALTNQQVAMGRIHTTKATLLEKLAAYERAHRDLAEAASAAAGGGAKGARIYAAIEAIPKVKLALASAAKIDAVLRLPGYGDESGRGFNGVGRPQDFVIHLSQLKGYKERFVNETKMWNERLKQLEAVAGKLDSGKS